MLKTLLSFCCLFSLLTAAAQDTPPCATFNDGSMGNWELINCLANPAAPFINPFDLTKTASVKDNHTTSVFENNTDYKKLGARFLGKCLVFDYNVRNDGVAGKRPLVHPTIYVSDKYGRSVYFTAHATVAEGTGWAHVRAPIVHFDYAKMVIPSNSDGNWTSPYLPGVFDEIIDSCVKISFFIDLLGSSATTEEINIDNVCVVDCQDSNSRNCYADFRFIYSNTTLKTHPNNHLGKVELFEFHKTSSYRVDWGDGFVAEDFEPHTYEPGEYEFRVTELTAYGGRCSASVPVCVSDKGEKKLFKTTADTSCNADFMIEVSTASNLTYSPKHTGDITLLSESAAIYAYNWGDGSPVSSSPLNHQYSGGEHKVCVTGVKADGAECKKCIDVCINARPDTVPAFIPDEQGRLSGFSIVPNPVSGEAHFLFGQQISRGAVLSIYDMMGKLAFTHTVAVGSSELSFDFSSFQPGIYIVRLASESGSYMERIIVSR